MNEKELLAQNEIKANKSMAFTSMVIAIILAIFYVLSFIGKCADLFSFTSHTVTYIHIGFPVIILLLLAPVCLLKTNFVKDPSFKYCVLVLFALAIGLINLVLPKDGVLLWALPVVMAALYFNPKVTKIIFILTSILLLISTPLSMFYGSWDSNLLFVTQEQFVEMVDLDGKVFGVDSFENRFYFVNHFKAICSANNIPGGLSRWAACYVFYFLPRFLILIVLAQVINGLSLRTQFILGERIKEAKYNQKIASQMTIASAVQNGILPKEFPNSSYGEVYALMNSAKEIGGDFYDFFEIDEKHLAIVIGDASGNGVASALYMMKAQSLIHSLTLALKSDTAAIMKLANSTMCAGNELNMFVTCWLGILNKESGELAYTNAGHNAPIIKHDGKFQYLSAKPGLVLGGFDGFEYQEASIKLAKGDKVLLYTDGVTEAHSVKSELYGEARLLEKVSSLDASPYETIVKIREDVREFTRNAELFDDLTMLMLEYRKPQSVFSKTFLAKNTNLDAVQKFIIDSIKFKMTPKEKNELALCIEEIFVNIASYSYEDYGYVSIDVNSDNNELTLVFKDNGVPFDPLAKEDPNTNASAEERGVGGLGIFIVKNLMDKCYYEYKDDRNILTLTKKY